MRAELSFTRDRTKQLSPTSSTFSSELSGVLDKLTLRRRLGLSRILEVDVEDGCSKFAGRSANLGERIVKPALAALSLLDGLGESLMVDLILTCFCWLIRGEVCLLTKRFYGRCYDTIIMENCSSKIDRDELE
jgi:hypothetical protein